MYCSYCPEKTHCVLKQIHRCIDTCILISSSFCNILAMLEHIQLFCMRDMHQTGSPRFESESDNNCELLGNGVWFMKSDKVKVSQFG